MASGLLHATNTPGCCCRTGINHRKLHLPPACRLTGMKQLLPHLPQHPSPQSMEGRCCCAPTWQRLVGPGIEFVSCHVSWEEKAGLHYMRCRGGSSPCGQDRETEHFRAAVLDAARRGLGRKRPCVLVLIAYYLKQLSQRPPPADRWEHLKRCSDTPVITATRVSRGFGTSRAVSHGVLLTSRHAKRKDNTNIGPTSTPGREHVEGGGGRRGDGGAKHPRSSSSSSFTRQPRGGPALSGKASRPLRRRFPLLPKHGHVHLLGTSMPLRRRVHARSRASKIRRKGHDTLRRDSGPNRDW